MNCERCGIRLILGAGNPRRRWCPDCARKVRVENYTKRRRTDPEFAERCREHQRKHARLKRERAEALVCQAEDCDARTAHRKPYCEEHVLLSPYAGAVAERVEQIQQDRARLNAGGRPLTRSPLAEDLVEYVAEYPGGCTVGMVSKPLGLTVDATRRLALALARAGRLRVNPTSARRSAWLEVA